MSGEILVASLAITAAILVVLYWKLSQEENSTSYPVMVLFLAFLMAILVLLSKASLDYNDTCEVVQNASIVINESNHTSPPEVWHAHEIMYTYELQCFENTNQTANIFYRMTLWVVRLLTAYLILSFAWQAIEYFGWKKKGGGQ